MKSSVGGRQVSKVNSSDKNKVIEEEDEEKAYEKIGEEFGLGPVKIIWRPEGMKFKKMSLDTDIQLAELDYLYNNENTEFVVSASYGEASLGADNEDDRNDDKGRNGKYFKKFVFYEIKCVSFLLLMCLLYREP